MYKSYKVSLDEIRSTVTTYKIYGKKLSAELTETMKSGLTQYLNPKGVLDGQKIMDDWFKQVDADIFISHSHRDDDDIYALAGWLKMNFGLNAFVDADVWGYCNDLILEMDKEYVPCRNGVYDYSKHNDVTAHVHIMLMSALAKMIDKCECLFFVDSDQSISARDAALQTSSPWIYNELLLSSMIKPRAPHRRAVRIQDSRVILEQREYTIPDMQVEYPAVLRHMKSLSLPTINAWKRQYSFYKTNAKYKELALDLLYNLVP